MEGCHLTVIEGYAKTGTYPLTFVGGYAEVGACPLTFAIGHGTAE